MTADPQSPQWEACTVCGGDHWTKDHRHREPQTEAGRRLLAGMPSQRDRGLRAAIIAVEAEAAALDVERLARALAVVFAYNESNASVAPNGSLAFGGEPTTYWRDRAEAVLDALEGPTDDR